MMMLKKLLVSHTILAHSKQHLYNKKRKPNREHLYNKKRKPNREHRCSAG